MQVVRAHKGKTAVRVEVIGRSEHSSRPNLGLNAVHAMAGLITRNGRAHRPNEYIEIGELAARQSMIEAFGARLAA